MVERGRGMGREDKGQRAKKQEKGIRKGIMAKWRRYQKNQTVKDGKGKKKKKKELLPDGSAHGTVVDMARYTAFVECDDL